MRALLAAIALLLAAPAAAGAHGVIVIAGGALAYLSDDSSSASRLEMSADLVAVRVYDPGSVGGIQAPSSCRAGRLDDRGFIIEYTCPATGIVALRAETGPNEDQATTTGALAARVSGDSGADELRTADAADELHGRDGNDVLVAAGGADRVDPGEGADTVDAGAGDDAVEAADGERDTIACGDGADRVAADQLDTVAADCETVERRQVEPPAASAEGDETPPLVSVRAPASRRVGSGRIGLEAKSLERGEISVSAYLAVSGVRLRVPAVSRAVPEQAWRRLALRLSRAQVRRVRRAGRAQLVVATIATDRAGNASVPRTVRIRLRR